MVLCSKEVFVSLTSCLLLLQKTKKGKKKHYKQLIWMKQMKKEPLLARTNPVVEPGSRRTTICLEWLKWLGEGEKKANLWNTKDNKHWAGWSGHYLQLINMKLPSTDICRNVQWQRGQKHCWWHAVVSYKGMWSVRQMDELATLRIKGYYYPYYDL